MDEVSYIDEVDSLKSEIVINITTTGIISLKTENHLNVAYTLN